MRLAVGAVEAASPTLVVNRKGRISVNVVFERGWAGDADVVAALNLLLEWERAFRYPPKAEVSAWKEKSAERTKTLPGGGAATASNSSSGDSARSTGVDATAMLEEVEVAA